jgi:hypothetical protein
MPWRINLSLKKYSFCDFLWRLDKNCSSKLIWRQNLPKGLNPRVLNPELQDWNTQIQIFSSLWKNFFCPIRQTVQKIIGDKLVADRQTTDRQQTDIFELTPIHMGNFNYYNFFFTYGWERTNGVKLIPPCSLLKFALLTCFARREINHLFFPLILYIAFNS